MNLRRQTTCSHRAGRFFASFSPYAPVSQAADAFLCVLPVDFWPNICYTKNKVNFEHSVFAPVSLCGGNRRSVKKPFVSDCAYAVIAARRRKEGLYVRKKLWEKCRESVGAVAPIGLIVLLLHVTVAPMPGGMLSLFLLGLLMLIVGMCLFSLGADLSMMPMGERIGAQLTRSKNLTLLIVTALVMGVLITVAEPDLQVLATQVPAVPDHVLIFGVAAGVGLFLALALLRIVFRLSLRWFLVGFYGLVFLLAAFVQPDFLPVAFDSGGVTTGPITVPFILALGIGVAAVRGGRSSHDDSFGLVALCSVGPILSVLLISMFYDPSAGSYGVEIAPIPQSAGEVFRQMGQGLPHYAKEVLLALAPIVAAFVVFQLAFLRLPRSQMIRTAVGVVYTYIGLAIFLTGANIGFLPAGNFLGGAIASLPDRWILIPIGMAIGFFVAAAEPAVHVLTKQVEQISGGAISRSAMLAALMCGVALSLGLAMARVLSGLSIWYIILPGYALALAMSFVTPQIFTAVAFDSGGVASGPMTATFLLPFAMGACEGVGGNVLSDAFGVVAMVAMTPLITIQILGLWSLIRAKRNPEQVYDDLDETELIELD